MFGGAGHDHLFAGDGNDWLDGGIDFDILYGGNGDDELNGGGDDDVEDHLHGGAGRDTFYWEHYIDDGLGLDFNRYLQEVMDFDIDEDIEV